MLPSKMKSVLGECLSPEEVSKIQINLLQSWKLDAFEHRTVTK